MRIVTCQNVNMLWSARGTRKRDSESYEWGLVITRSYFLHVSCIRSGTATPEPGMEVFFEVDETKPVPDGKLPRAIRADVIVPDDKAGA